ncbi:protein PTCD3 homolog, mitochondrial-like, partial [Pollicipes pollicipes]|uniref:protein PTCD3 homolog, mitochondrial-like n=1 Tax=Pollicipes pollicipes TaxID=41117 RepID=UPI001884B398
MLLVCGLGCVMLMVLCLGQMMASNTCRVMLKFSGIRARGFCSRYRRLRYCTSSQTTVSTDSQGGAHSQTDDIVIPDYVKRSPTDILKALSSTVGRDVTSTHYKFHDDPYLVPGSNLDKRMFSLSREAGRNAARWVRDRNAELFEHQVAQPFSETFAPRPVYDENTAADEAVLQEVIEQGRVSDAITVYQKLSKENVELSRETRQALLELLCFYNGEDTLDEERLEERWFSNTGTGNKARKTWKDNGVAEEVFRSLEPLDGRAYNTLIKGMTKFYQADRAKQLWEEMQNRGFEPELETYNYMITVASFVMESAEKQWEYVEGMLRRMAGQGLRPGAATLSAVLQAVWTMGSWRRARDVALATWREFRQLGVQPTLASYYFLLSVFYRDRASSTDLLKTIMDEIQGKTFTIQHPMDTFFFTTAMGICRNKLQDRDLALRLDELLHTGSNYDLIGDSYKESVYYRNLLALLYGTEPIEDFMANFYNKLVPNVYTPEPGIMEGLVNAVSMSGAVEYLPQLWTDMVAFGLTNRESLLKALLRALALNPGKEDEARRQLAAVGWDLFERVEQRRTTRTDGIHWAAGMLGDLMLVLTRAGHISRAASVLRKLDREQAAIVGVPDAVAVQSLFDVALVNQRAPVCVLCARYAAEMGFEAAPAMADSLLQTLPVTDDERQQ